MDRIAGLSCDVCGMVFWLRMLLHRNTQVLLASFFEKTPLAVVPFLREHDVPREQL
jgi:hypothetical protein